MADQESSPPNELARLLLELQKHHHFSTSELARRLGCHRSLLYRWLKGACLPQKMSHIQSIARVSDHRVEAIQHLLSQIPLPASPIPSREQLLHSLSLVQGPADLPGVVSRLCEEVFRAEQAELFLAGLTLSLPCLWCASVHPHSRESRLRETIPLGQYVVDWSSFVSRTQEDLVVRALATRQVQEYSDGRYLQQLGITGTWFCVVPLVWDQRSLGCLVLTSSLRAYLSDGERSAAVQVCRRLAEGLAEHAVAFDRVGMDRASRMLLDSYRHLEKKALPHPLYLTGLAEQLAESRRFLLSIARHLREIQFPFHDLSLQQIDDQSGTMLAIGTQHGKSLLPPALFDPVTAAPCWESFKKGQPVYRPNLRRQDPHGELDPFSHQPVLAILDVPLNWGKYRGTVGINSLEPDPWTESDLVFLRDFLQSFDCE